MIESGIRQPFVVQAVQPDAMKLLLHVVVATAGHVVEQPVLFVDACHTCGFEGIMGGQRIQQFPTEVV